MISGESSAGIPLLHFYYRSMNVNRDMHGDGLAEVGSGGTANIIFLVLHFCLVIEIAVPTSSRDKGSSNPTMPPPGEVNHVTLEPVSPLFIFSFV